MAIQCTQRRGKGSLDADLDLMSRWISVRPACFVVNMHRFFGCLMNDLFDGTGIYGMMSSSLYGVQWPGAGYLVGEESDSPDSYLGIVVVSFRFHPDIFINRLKHFKCIFRQSIIRSLCIRLP